MSSPRAAASRPAMTSPVFTPMRRPTSPPCRATTRSANPPKLSRMAIRSPHGALGIVLVRLRDPEDGEDRIPDELLRHAAVALDLRVHELEEIALKRPHVLGVEPLPERRGAGQVGEEDRARHAVPPGRRWPLLFARPPGARSRTRSRRPPRSIARRRRPGTPCASDAPHVGQKRPLAGTSEPHETQVAATSRVYGTARRRPACRPAARRRPSSRSCSRTRNWNAVQAPRGTSISR